MSFIAGPYTATYNSVDIGITEDGFDLDNVTFQELIRGDNLGSADQDGVYRSQNCFLSFVGEEWNKLSSATIFRPWAAFGVSGQVGRLASDSAKVTLLTVVAGTPASIAGLNTVSASKSILASDFNVKHAFSTRLRKLALRLQLFPYTNSSDITWFTTT